jgi:outer membrane translocation and assembly module TamA
LEHEAGIVWAPARDGIPEDFLFRAGGTRSVRGYAYRSLGVRDGEAVVGGRYLATGTVEYVRWLSPAWFRFGASSLLNDVLMQLEKERTGRYQRPTDFSAD